MRILMRYIMFLCQHTVWMGAQFSPVHHVASQVAQTVQYVSVLVYGQYGTVWSLKIVKMKQT